MKFALAALIKMPEFQNFCRPIPIQHYKFGTKLSTNQAENCVLVIINQTLKEILNVQQLKNRTEYVVTIEFQAGDSKCR